MDVFVSSPFSQAFDKVFQAIDDVSRERELAACRVDQEHVVDPIATEIQRQIRDSRVIIADITSNNANVLNEIGQAQSLGKPLILISQDRPEEAPFNIRGLRILRYDPDDLDGLRAALRRALSKTTSPNETLRAMLVPSSLERRTAESKFVVAASPLSYRRAKGSIGGYKELRRTSSDYVGIRMILQAFGALYGFETLPDIVEPDDCDDEVLNARMNLYSIASPKANPWTGMLLDLYAKSWVPALQFRPDPGSTNLKNINVSLFDNSGLVCPFGWDLSAPGDRYFRDFGLIVRGPNPNHGKQMIAILAGRSSLGTEAACTAFTDPKQIGEIRRLSGENIDLEDHRRPFWALVSMKRARGDGKEEAIPESLKVCRVHAFDPV